jgi:hypothetical protein
VLIGAGEGFAAVALGGAALALHTVAAVISPVQTAAEAMTRAVCSAGVVDDLGPWLPAGVRMVPGQPDLPIEHGGRGAGPAPPHRGTPSWTRPAGRSAHGARVGWLTAPAAHRGRAGRDRPGRGPARPLGLCYDRIPAPIHRGRGRPATRARGRGYGSTTQSLWPGRHVGRPRTGGSGASQARASRFAKRRGGRRGTASASSSGGRPVRRPTASFWPVTFGGVSGARAGSPIPGGLIFSSDPTVASRAP